MIRILFLCSVALFYCGLFAGATLAAGPTEYLLADRPNYSLGIGFDYETGDYGTDSNSDFVSVPLYLDIYPTDRLDIELIIPYVYLSTEDDSTTTVWYRTSGGATNSVVRGRNRTTTDSSDTTVTSETTTAKHSASESGLGDITLTAGYIVVEENQAMPQVRPTFYLKFPTADEDKGLGTGEFDFGPGLTLSKWWGDLNLFVEGLYIIQGDSPLYDAKDYFSYNGGVGQQFSDNFYGAVLMQGATEPADGAEDSLEGRLKWVWRLAPDTALEGYFGTGFSDSSADFSASVAAFFDF